MVVVKLRFSSKSIDYEQDFKSIKIDLKKILGHAIFDYGDKSFEFYIPMLGYNGPLHNSY